MNDFETEFIGLMHIPEEDRDVTLFLINTLTILCSSQKQNGDYKNCLELFIFKCKIKVKVEKNKIILFRRGGKLKTNICLL